MNKTFDNKTAWKNAPDKNLGSKLLLFIVWPFGAWLSCFKSANTKSSYIIYFLFSLLLCWHMSPNNTTGLYDDFLGIMDRFRAYDFSTQEILYQINAYFSFADDAPKELYENIVIWFVKSFTGNYHFYFLVCAIPVALFQLGCLKRMTQDSRFQAGSFYAIACMVMLIFPRDIITVQNPRFTTGFWLCIYCIINYSDSNKRIYKIIPVILAPMIHSGLWLMSIFAIAFVFVPKVTRIWELFAMATIPFCFLDSNILMNVDFSAYLPSFLYQWSLLHFDPDNSNVIQGSGFHWVGVTFTVMIKIMYAYMVITMIRNKEELMKNSEAEGLYSMLLAFFGLTNLIQGVPVLGERYYWAVQILVMFVWFKAFYPARVKTMKCLLISNSLAFVFRYGYILGGALAVNTPPDIFFTPLPYLMGKGLLW